MNRRDKILGRVFGPGVNSPDRLGVMVSAICDVGPLDPDVFWPVFLETWSACDATWDWRGPLLTLLRAARKKRPAIHYMSGDSIELFDGLPDPTPIYRGCSASRVRGISWTIERSIALRFKRGHRFITVPTPVLAEAVVRKDAIFCTIADREESEVLIDPRRLRRLTVA